MLHKTTNQILKFSIFFTMPIFVFLFLFNLSFAHASPCEILNSSPEVQIGFGAAYNTLSVVKETLITADCLTDSANIQIGNGQTTQYVYKYGYIWKNSKWEIIELTPLGASLDVWLIGKANINIPLSAEELANENFLVAYICSWTGTNWKCGCRDAYCIQSYWQLQKFQKDICVENWTCADWTVCVNSNQIRTCVDQNNCGTTNNKPPTSQNCADTCQDADEDDYDNCAIGEAGDDGKVIDCDDNERHVYPNNKENCDTIDNNCDGQTDEGCDKDIDGYCDEAMLMYRNNLMCLNTIFTADGQNGDDCNDDNDSNGSIHPNATEICGNGIDEDCDGNDLACSCSPIKTCADYPDQCGVNFFDGCANILNCANNCSGKDICCNDICQTAECEYDANCNDNDDCTIDACLNPNTCYASCSYKQITTCFDNDGCCPSGCVNANDNNCAPTCNDKDGDRYIVENTDIDQCGIICGQGKNEVCLDNNDCDDNEFWANPGGNETCDTIDNNCNSQTDENCDSDNDGFCSDIMKIYRNNSMCIKNSAGDYVNGYFGDDCNDDNGSINPEIAEICENDIDDNCDGSVNEDCDTISPIVSEFDIQPRVTAESITAIWTVTDDQSLSRVELWRANDLNSLPNSSSWIQIQTKDITGISATGEFIDRPSVGVYWYGIHVFDQQDNMGVEPNEPIKIEIINSEPYCIQSGIYWSKASYLGNVVELYDGWTSGGVGGGLIYRSDSEPEIDLLELFGPESIYGCANKIESVWYYDHINDSWLSYGFDAPEFLNKLYTIETGKIYSIMPKEPCVLNYSGEGSFWKADYCEHGCESGECLVSVCVDVDQDGYDTCNIGDTGDDGKEIDCNDNNNLINSGKTEICGNGIDDNCDGSIDENCEGNCSADSDCDDNNSCTTDSCSNPGQWNSRCINIVEEQGVEICTNGIDDDCDGLIDYNDDDCKINAEGSKLSSKYSSKQAFLISDKNWQDVLPLIPAAVWTGNEDWCQRGYGTPENVCVNPVLIYHEEESGFDADSIIHFIQQYSPDNLTIAGDIPQDLSNLLISEREFGAGLLVEQIKQITTNDYFSYWENYNSIVYVENNYELALLASTYASLINAPLVIQGTINDTDSVFINKNVICVGNVARSCNENYNLEQLQQKYVDMTNTDKIILVNPNDLNIKVEENFTPNKSASINEIYSRTSLAASILASAKHELIISSPYSDNINVDSYLETKISELINAPLYLTILASPEAIQLNKMQERISGLNINIASDIYYYSNLNSDLFSELKTGRIFGISNADVSSLLARNIFYNSIEQSNNASSLYNNGGSNFKRKGKTNDNVLGGIGLNIQSQYLDELPEIRYDLSKLENQKVITYLDHGSPTGGYSITTYDLNNNDIRFSNSLFVSDSCMQCAYQEEKINLFCANVIRRGAVGFIGSLDETTHIDYVGRIADFQLGETIGSAIQEFSNERYLLGQMGGTYSYYSPFFYLGDPTLDLGLPKPNSTIISNYNNKKLDIYIPFDWETFHVYEYSQDRYYYITSGGKNLRDPNRSESGDNVRFYDKLFFHFTETDLVAVKDVYINGVLNGFNEEECLLVSSENCKMYEKNLGNFRIVLERLNDVYFVSIHFDQILPKTQIEVNNGINIEINFN